MKSDTAEEETDETSDEDERRPEDSVKDHRIGVVPLPQESASAGFVVAANPGADNQLFSRHFDHVIRRVVVYDVMRHQTQTACVTEALKLDGNSDGLVWSDCRMNSH